MQLPNDSIGPTDILSDMLVKMGYIPDDTPEYYGMRRPVIETGVTDLRPGVKGQLVLDLAFDHPAQGAST